MPKAKSSIFEALLRKCAMEGAINPRMIRGTRKKIICPVRCLMEITTSNTASLTKKPAARPMITAMSSCTMVLPRNFFICFFQLNDGSLEKVCCMCMLFHTRDKDRKIIQNVAYKNRERWETSRPPPSKKSFCLMLIPCIERNI